MKFHNLLETWYLNNKRDLPWRTTQNPYHIWLSEIILQQTRVQQGLSYYEKFINHYPTIFDLANASEDVVLKDWQGLGYYSRARNLHFTAKYICDELKGIFPNTFKDLKKLKGVGDYTAAAIASFSFHEKVAVVDGNVYRVLARYFNIDIAINSPKGVSYFKKLAQELINEATPHVYNQAIMEFGAMVCKPQNPSCINCPIATGCLAFAKNTIALLPLKEKKTTIKHRYFNYIVIYQPEGTVLEQRKAGIWKGLYQFPLVESTHLLNDDEMLVELEKLQIRTSDLYVYNQQPIVHKLTHQHLHTNFWMVTTNAHPYTICTWNMIHTLAVPQLIHNFLDAINRT